MLSGHAVPIMVLMETENLDRVASMSKRDQLNGGIGILEAQGRQSPLENWFYGPVEHERLPFKGTIEWDRGTHSICIISNGRQGDQPIHLRPKYHFWVLSEIA